MFKYLEIECIFVNILIIKEKKPLNLLFKQIRLVNPNDELDVISDLWIKDGIIKQIKPNLQNYDTETQIIDSANFVCCPGLFDMHVHFRTPGQNHKETIESGSNSAANGGFTGVVCMPNTSPAIDNDITLEWLINNSKDNIIDIKYSAAITQNRKGEKLTNMNSLNDKGVVLFTDDGDPVKSADMMKKAFDYASTNDLLLSQHCEETSLTSGFGMDECELSFKLGLKGYPSVAEEIIINRDILLSEYCGNRRYHVQHLSTWKSVYLVRQAKKKGIRVTCEVSPHHLSLDHNNLSTFNTNFKMNPPLRSQNDIDLIIEGLKDGTIDCIATDHAPHTEEEKNNVFDLAPNGIVGLETSLGVCLTNLFHTEQLSLNEIILKMSINPRLILNLEVPKIEEGVMANLTIFDPNELWKVDKTKFVSKSRNTPYNEIELKGKPKYTFNNNKYYISNL